MARMNQYKKCILAKLEDVSSVLARQVGDALGPSRPRNPKDELIKFIEYYFRIAADQNFDQDLKVAVVARLFVRVCDELKIGQQPDDEAVKRAKKFILSNEWSSWVLLWFEPWKRNAGDAKSQHQALVIAGVKPTQANVLLHTRVTPPASPSKSKTDPAFNHSDSMERAVPDTKPASKEPYKAQIPISIELSPKVIWGLSPFVLLFVMFVCGFFSKSGVWDQFYKVFA